MSCFSTFHKIHVFDPLDCSNLKKLGSKKKGELFIVRNNQIVSISFYQKIPYILFAFYRRKEHRTLRKTIDTLTSKIKLDERCTSSEKEYLEYLFLNKLSSLSRRVYKRALDPTVFKYLHTKTVCEEIPSTLSTEYQDCYKIAKTWARLGSYKSPQGGFGGSYCIIQNLWKENSFCKTKLGIYKPFDEDTLAARNPKLVQKIKYWLYRTLFFPVTKISFNTVGGQGYLAEVVTKIIETYVIKAIEEYKKPFKLNLFNEIELVRDTYVAKIALRKSAERIGSFQLWVQGPNQCLANRFLKTTRHYNCSASTLKKMKNKIPIPFFELLSIIDIASGNFDRHGENWIVIHDEKEKVIGIRLIDGDCSMAPGHVKEWNLDELRNHYLWAKLPFAKHPFSGLGKHIITYLNETQEELCNQIRDLYQTYLPNNNFVELRLDAMKDRLKVLFYAKETKTMREIAQIRTERAIQKYLHAAANIRLENSNANPELVSY